jgi:DNA polymerase-3 subunit beta
MQLIISLKKLKLMVAAAEKAIAKPAPLEILNNFKLAAKNDLFSITATDLKLWLIGREDCNTIKEEGEVALNAKRLSDVVKSLRGEEVSIKVSQGAAVIKCGKSKFSLPTISASEYPSMPEISQERAFAIPTALLHQGISATLKTVSDNITKPALQGVHIYEFDETLEGEDDPTHFLAFVSADGSRGSYFKVVSPPLASLAATIPTRTLREVEYITQAETEITITNGRICFLTHSLIVASPLIQQPYPPVSKTLLQLRKQKMSGSIKCDRKELIESLKRVNTLSDSDIYDQRVDMLIEGEELKFFSEIADVGNVEESMICNTGSGSFRSLFNPKYLLLILDTISSKQVKLEAYEGVQRCLFASSCDGTDHETFLMAIAEIKRYKPEAKDDDD